MNLRRFMKRSAFIRWLLDPYGELARDDALYAADTADLERARRRDAGAVEVRVHHHAYRNECPIEGCAACPERPVPAWVRLPAVDPDRSCHTWTTSARSTRAVVAWLIETYPDAWYYEMDLNPEDVAICLLLLRDRVHERQVAP